MPRLSALLDRTLGAVFSLIFGSISWTPPTWISKLAKRIEARVLSVRGRVLKLKEQSPGLYKGLVAFLFVLPLSLALYFDWASKQPKPHLLEFSVSEIAPTPFTPGAKPYSLNLKFKGSAAPLELVGKALVQVPTMQPPVRGVWNWVSDAELVFTPDEEWPVGYQGKLEFTKRHFASHVRLKEYGLVFRGPVFSAKIEATEFYEDPQDPKNKRVVAKVQFSHVPDRASLERNIRLKYRIEPSKSFEDEDAKTLGFRVVYDDQKGRASIQSDPIAIPEEAGEVLLELLPEIKAQRGGPGTIELLSRTTQIPSLRDYFRLLSAEASVQTNKNDEAERIATLSFTAAVRSADLKKKVKVFVLPKDRPQIGAEGATEDFDWSDPESVVPEVLKIAKAVPVEWIPTKETFSKVQSFRFKAESSSWVYILVEKGLSAFGDYPLVKDSGSTIYAEEFPKLVRISGEGGILSLSGDKQVQIASRNVPSVKYEVFRMLPQHISQLVGTSAGAFQNPRLLAPFAFNADSYSERFSKVESITGVVPGRVNYNAIDLGAFMRESGSPRGVFFLKVRAWSPEDAEREKRSQESSEPPYTVVPETYEASYGAEAQYGEYEGNPGAAQGDSTSDFRLIVLSDLGLVAKESSDGSIDVFVLSLREGIPVVGAEVELLGRNGLPVVRGVTQAEGRVQFPPVKQFTREKAPTVFVAKKDADFAFLPYRRSDRILNYSKFDTGGLYNRGRNDALQAYLFSDRGAYRPGDLVHVGLVLKTVDWRALPENIPLELVVTDPRGVEVKKEKVLFSREGFQTVDYLTSESAPTGTYDFSLYVLNDGERSSFLGSTRVRVEEFQPDRMKVTSLFYPSPGEGWMSPQDVRAIVTAKNLFGTDAVGRKVTSKISLVPISNSFPKFNEYRFYDEPRIRESYNEELGETLTNDQGQAEVALGLERFVDNLYQLRFTAEVFEPDSGRSVTTESRALISTASFVLGYKPDGNLSFVRKDSARSIQLLALNSNLVPIAVKGIAAELYEVKYVSTLVQQADGLLRYQSERVEELVNRSEIVVPEAGLKLSLQTKSPGSYLLKLKSSEDILLNKVEFEVAGDGNASGSLEKNAELSVRIKKKQYVSGEDIELDIRAPYTGYGLITIERDKVYASKWFKAETNSIAERITLPEGVEGNAYVVVNYVRSLDSKEIFMSPLSYSAVPFEISKGPRTNSVTLSAPEMIKPGEPIKVQYALSRPGRLVVFGVDEGILQFARYKLPDPLQHFFRKRALEVKTSQILDLLMPEYSLLRELSAPGGDEDFALSKHLNPFKRKNQKPFVYWSGILEASNVGDELSIPSPDYFNGSFRVMAVVVSEAALGVAEKSVTVQGDFVLEPHAPYFVAPGDSFSLSTLVANNVKGSGEAAQVEVSVESCPGLEIVQEAKKTVGIPEGRDGTVEFVARALDNLGACNLTFRATSGVAASTYSLELSIRPKEPLTRSILSGYLAKGVLKPDELEQPLTRSLRPEFRKVEAGISNSPLALSWGLVRYLKEFPYGCTEQVVSQAFPGVVLGSKPELGLDQEFVEKRINQALAVLRSRQNNSGAFGTWAANSDVSNFQTAYAAHFLIEAREKGLQVPQDLIERVVSYLESQQENRGQSLPEMRAIAYALYVLTRGGTVTTNYATQLRAFLEESQELAWKEDLTGLFLAATYKLLRMDAEAEKLLRAADPDRNFEAEYEDYYDPLLYRGMYFYILANHFPEKAAKLAPEVQLAFVDALVAKDVNTISAGVVLLGLEALSRKAQTVNAAGKLFEVRNNGERQELFGDSSWFKIAPVSREAVAVRYELSGEAPLFYQLEEFGYDKELKGLPVSQKISVFHELKNEKGEVISEVSLQDKAYVHLLVRALEEPVPHVAVVDLLPGGFELDLSPEAIGKRASLESGDDTWMPSFIDAREDRLLLFGTLDTTVKRFVYRIKPMNKGEYALPPPFAEGMYDRAVRAIGEPKSIRVGD